MKKYAPFHISVAATAIYKGKEQTFFSFDDVTEHYLLNLSPEHAHALLEYLDKMQRKGYMVCSWNGLSFDFKWLGYQANDMALAARIALKSYDPMFQFFNMAGFPVKLSKVGEGMGVPQKKLLNGANAPSLWQAGHHQEVIDYCLGDCQITNAVIVEILRTHTIRWITQKGHAASKPMSHLKRVEEVIREPEPDQSWMSDPLPKSQFYAWIRDALCLSMRRDNDSSF